MRLKIASVLAGLMHGISAILLVILLMFVYLYFIDGNPPVTYEQPWKMIKTEYKAGDYLIFEVQACRERSIPFTNYAKIVDGFNASLETRELTGFKAGCGTGISNDMRIPEFIPPGKYKLQGDNVFHVNFLRDRVIPWETDYFYVI